MLVVEQIGEVREALKAARTKGEVIGFVPTMGALHAGHLSLVRAAREECECAVVSVFVNPIQFAPGEDCDQYPRSITRDLDQCRSAGVDLVFNPPVDEMYGTQRVTAIGMSKLTDTLCGAHRPGHFEGVMTVVAKLFNIVQPDVAYFGQKDAQQALVIRRMVTDLDFPIRVRVCPTVRDPDGLALSSRNAYLSDDERTRALCLSKALGEARGLVRSGEKNAETITARMREVIESGRPEHIDYVDIVDPLTMSRVTTVDRPVLVAVAAKIGAARLIDNILLDVNSSEIIIDDLSDTSADAEKDGCSSDC